MSNIPAGSFNNDLAQEVLLKPIGCGADKLIIISGYASHNMASWHMKKISELSLKPIDIALTVGMCPEDGLRVDIHEGFKGLVSFRDAKFSSFSCKYIYRGPAVHSKIYLWLKNGQPVCAYAGSANYTQAGFGLGRREYIVQCDPVAAYEYYQNLENDTIFCNHAEVEEAIVLKSNSTVQELEEGKIVPKTQLPKVTLSLLTRDGDVGYGSGINWGHRRDGTKREPNQAYIPLPAHIARSGFFPLERQHFSVMTDDSKQLILRVEQQNDKAVTTPLNNSLLGEYLRSRIHVSNGAFVTRQDLVNYGRTDVTFYKIDDEQYYMDFSTNGTVTASTKEPELFV